MANTKSSTQPRNFSIHSNVADYLSTIGGFSSTSPDDGIARAEGLHIANEAVRKCEPSDFAFVDLLVVAINKDLESRDSGFVNAALELLQECVIYYMNIGDLDTSLKNSLKALAYSELLGNKALQRRSHNLSGGSYLRLSRFDKAFEHLEASYQLAVEIDDRVAVFAALGNAVAVLETMGLLAEGIQLALDISKTQPWGEDRFCMLHLCNANNGLRMCQRLENYKTAKHFYAVAKKAFAVSIECADDLSKAHFHAAEIVFQVGTGQIKDAIELSKIALKEYCPKENVHIRSLMVCANAALNVAKKSIDEIECSINDAKKLLPLIEHIPECYEEVLRTIISLYRAFEEITQIRKSEEALGYEQSLRTFIFSVKHRYYFMGLTKDMSNWTAGDVLLECPRYSVPNWLLESVELVSSRLFRSFVKQNLSELTCLDFEELKVHRESSKLRTAHYVRAENIAFSAEVANGGRGQHCVLVGRIAALIAKEVGLCQADINQLELACRLHDIGMISGEIWKLPLDERRAIGKLSVFCKHAQNGEQLLLASTDETLRVGARIAKSHHEWWNGCGYPYSLVGEEIPLEGRICAVADTFASLIYQDFSSDRWSPVQAIHQLTSMSGMQLDPKLVAAFVRAVGDLDYIAKLTSVFGDNFQRQGFYLDRCSSETTL